MGQRSAVAETDWHRLAKDRFADDLADILYKQAHRGRFRRLVIVAAPHVLGELRNKLHPEVARKVIAEIPETLTNHPVDKIEQHVRQHLQQYERHFGPEKRPL
jgi:protein required for attachment to host cells